MSGSGTQVRNLALLGVGWSIVQNWGGKLFTFIIFILLAKLLSPTEFGLASAAAAVLLIISQVAEFGYGEAIIQRHKQEPSDSNAPFFLALLLSLVLMVVCILCREVIESNLAINGLGLVVSVAVCAAPLNTLLLFQEVHYQRNFRFRSLGMRSLVANISGGIFAIFSAYIGFGVWSLLVQSYVVLFVGLIWLWARPLWSPTMVFKFDSFAELTRYSWPVVTQRLLDIGSGKLFEFVLLSFFGPAAFGLYAVGARLYQTLSQLMHGALNAVSMTILSAISNDDNKIKVIYQKTILTAAMLFAPIYVFCAAIIPEVSIILFGDKWVGVDEVARPLLLLGAVQSIQFMNGPYLSARGRSGTVLLVGSIRGVSLLCCLFLFQTDSLVGYVKLFAFSQLIATPASFFLTFRELGVQAKKVFVAVLPSLFGCAVSYWCIVAFRFRLDEFVSLNPVRSVAFFALLFFLTYVGCIVFLGRKHANEVIIFLGLDGKIKKFRIRLMAGVARIRQEIDRR